MPQIEHSRSFSSIQGKVSRAERLGDLTLTDTQYSPRLRLSPHAHESACFGFVLAGGFSEQFPIQKLSYSGHAVFFRPPELVHEEPRLHSRCALLLPGSFASVAGPRRGVQSSPRTNRSVLRLGTLQKLANCLYEQWQDMDDVAPLTIEGLACEMAAQFCRTVRVRREPNPPRWLRQVHEILRCRFKESLRLTEISREVRMHPVHVAREFHRYYGSTVGQFRRKCRIDFACERLAQSRLPIVEIALESGFTQQPHFTNVFRKFTGLTPHQYRRLYDSKPLAGE